MEVTSPAFLQNALSSLASRGHWLFIVGVEVQPLKRQSAALLYFLIQQLPSRGNLFHPSIQKCERKPLPTYTNS